MREKPLPQRGTGATPDGTTFIHEWVSDTSGRTMEMRATIAEPRPSGANRASVKRLTVMKNQQVVVALARGNAPEHHRNAVTACGHDCSGAVAIPCHRRVTAGGHGGPNKGGGGRQG